MSRFTVRFWGVRGSLATSGWEYMDVGGNTSCVEVRIDDEIIILDAGTGVFGLGQTLEYPVRATFFITHFHWDHIQGFPFFRPAYRSGNAFVLYGPATAGGLEAALARQMDPPGFPVALATLDAALAFRHVEAGDTVRVGPATVRCAALNHPQGCLGYRIEVGGMSLVYATDTEPPDAQAEDLGAVALADGADLLICDAQYTEDEYVGRCGPPRNGWGHSTVGAACHLARAAGAKRLALFHHDPAHDDRRIAAMVADAQRRFPNVVAAREGLMIDLSGCQEAPAGRGRGRHPAPGPRRRAAAAAGEAAVAPLAARAGNSLR